jgi:predicted phage tail protein
MIYLHGYLRDRFGDGFDLAVNSVSEAISALCCVVPGFLEAFRDGEFRVLVGDEAQTLETVGMPSGHLPIHIVPVVAGGKDDLMQVLTGAALIAAGYFFGGPGGGMLAQTLMGMGTSMALGGVAQMLAGHPQAGGPDNVEVRNGKFFNGAENTSQQGCCIPVGYGEMEVGSIVISAGTTAEAYPCGANGGPFGGNPGTWTKAGNVWSNGGDGVTVPLCLGVDPV